MESNLKNIVSDQLKNQNNLEIQKKLIIDSIVNNKQEVFLIGRNADSEYLLQVLNVKGIIDDYSNNTSTWNGVSIFNSSSLSKEIIIVNCSTSISPLSVLKMLKNNFFKNVINYSDLILYSDHFKKPDFVLEMESDFVSNYSYWENLYNNLHDELSRKTLFDIIKFRLTGNPKFMIEYNCRIEEQYIEKFMAFNREIFCDIGGFDGDTAEAFLKKYPDTKKVLFFEPSSINILKAKDRLVKYTNIEYYNYGLSDTSNTFCFTEGSGSASAISEKGNTTIEVRKLDDIYTDSISFIKMDIEGWEMAALRGAVNHIKNDSPKLAIAVYHNAFDFWRIPELIFSINDNYDIYLRHYTEGWSESVMFFKPKVN